MGRGKNNIIPVVAACIIAPHPLRVLLHQKVEPRNPELMGKWEFPGGMMEYGESPEQALGRELREELGRDFTVFVIKLLYAQSNIYTDKTQYLVLFYECLWHHHPAPDGCRWFAPGEIEKADCLPGTSEVIRYILKEYSHPGVVE